MNPLPCRIECGQLFINNEPFILKISECYLDFDSNVHNCSKIQVNLSLDDDLDFTKTALLAEKIKSQGGYILWDIKLDMPEFLSQLRFEGLYNAHFFSLQSFVEKLYASYSDSTIGVIIFSGDIKIGSMFKWSPSDLIDFQEWLFDLYQTPSKLFGEKQAEILGEFQNFSRLSEFMLEITPFSRHLKLLHELNIMCAYLHRLVASLPEHVQAFVSLETKSISNLAFLEQLLSKERFSHLNLIIEDKRVSSEAINLEKRDEHKSIGLCFPNDELCTNGNLQQLHQVLTQLYQAQIPCRVIPEFMLTSSWDGLDQLIYIKKGLSSQGKRILQGFHVACGKLIYIDEGCGFEGESELTENFDRVKVSG